MKNYTTAQQLIMGLALSALGVLLLELLASFVNTKLTFSLTIVALTLSYSVLLLRRSEVKVGQASILLAYVACSSALISFDVTSDWVGFLALLMIWLTRIIFNKNSFFSACCSALVLSGSYYAALAVLITTGSWFLAFWCFFMIQALFSLVPSRLLSRTVPEDSKPDDSFKLAFRSANKALDNLSKI